MNPEHIERLRAMQRYALIGQLMRGVFHEINNGVQAITSYSELLLMTTSSEKHERFTQELQVEALRLSEHTQSLLQRDARRRLHAPRRLIDSTVGLCRHRLRRDHVQLKLDVDDALPKLDGHPERVEQVLLNLVMNARDAALERASGERWIRLEARGVDDGARLQIAVEDSGAGVPEGAEARLFQPFFTTRPPPRAGLGLYLSRHIAEAHGGSLTLDRDAEATRFSLMLPAA